MPPAQGQAAKRRFGDFAIDCVGRDGLVAWCAADVAARHRPPRVVMDVNGHALSLARTDPAYRAQVAQADIIHADGGFLVTLSRRLAGPAIPERSATTDMIHDFAAHFARTGGSFFLLGGEEATNAEAARRLADSYPGLRIAGRHHGYFTDAEEPQVAGLIDRSGADVVWVGLGKPREQAVALRLRDRVSACWIITCGGCFNYITGAYPRAPRWMQKANLEWLHRLATDPRRLFRRYALTNPHALWIALTRH
ncbi:MAG: hypothetical protein RIR62_3353 [Pseudomonadota bacterium]